MDRDYSQFVFGNREQPSYRKFNSLLQFMEDDRLLHGPYSISFVSAPTATSATIKLDETEEAMGSYYGTDPYYLNRTFSLEFRNDIGTNLGYARFENLKFTWSDSGYYYTTLNNSNKIYPRSYKISGGSNVNLSGTVISSYRLYSYDVPNRYRWGLKGEGLRLTDSGGTDWYFFATTGGQLRFLSSIPTAGTDGTAV